MSERKNEKLWKKAKSEVMKDGKRWDARKAQRAVKIYKNLGGTYIGKKNKNNSLVKWTDENWQYYDSRYLPEYIGSKLSKAEIKKESDKKKKAGRKNAPWTEKVKKLYRKMNKITKQQKTKKK